MEEMKGMEEVLRQVLSKAREEYGVLASWDNLLGAHEDERQLYFARYSLLKQLISSIGSFLDENQKLRQLELQLRKTP